MIAPSFQRNSTIESEPFKKGNKLYVKIKNNNTGNTRDARWYSEAEYIKAFPSEKSAFTAVGAPYKVHDCLGFGGFTNSIIIYHGPNAKDETYEPFKKSNARYHKLWGWYIIHNEPVPIVDKINTPIKLRWAQVGNEDGTLKDEKEIKKVLKDIYKRCEECMN